MPAMGVEDDECQTQADAASAPLDDKMAAIGAAWKVKNFYKPDDMGTIANDIAQYLLDARNHLAQYLRGGTVGTLILDMDPAGMTGLEQVNWLWEPLLQKWSEGATYVNAVTQAKASGIDVIDSPGFKSWAIDSVAAASTIYANVALLACQTPWWVSAITKAVSALAAIANFVYSVAEVVVKAGETVLKIPDFLAEMWNIAKWTAILGGAAYAAWLLTGHDHPEFVRKRLG